MSTNKPYLVPVDVGKYYNSGSPAACSENKYCIYGTEVACPSATASDLSTKLMSSETGNFYCTHCDYGNACYPTEDKTVACYNGSRYSRSGNTDCFQCEVDQDCVYRNQYFDYKDKDEDQISCPYGYYANLGDLVCKEKPYKSNYCEYGYVTKTIASGAGHPAENSYGCDSAGASGPLASGVQSCVVGTASMAGFPYCAVSMPGYLMSTNDLTSAGNVCPEGYYCSVDFSFSTSTYSLKTSRCPPGTYAPIAGGKSEGEACHVCPVGQYCNGTSYATTCDNGKFCELGTVNQTLTCPLGFYLDPAAAEYTTYGACKPCILNQYCPSGSSASTAAKTTGCLYGHQTFDARLYASPEGKYVSVPATVTLAACLTGKYCPAGDGVGVSAPVFYSPFS